MYIDFNQIARLGKLIALLGFLLPWVTVSCSNTAILTATGWQLMTGDPQPVGAGNGVEMRGEDWEPAVLVIAAFGLVLIGLACSLWTRARAAAATMLVCAVLAIGVSYYSVENIRHELRREASEANAGETGILGAEQQREITQSVSSAITVKEEEGYIVTHTGLLIAALFSLLTLFRRTKTEAAPNS